MVYSLLDNDLYKFTMAQCIYHNFTNTEVEYELFIRSKNVDLRPYKLEIERNIRDLTQMILSVEEYNFLKSIKFLSDDFVDWFRSYRFRPDEHVFISEDDNNLKIIVKGNWLDTIFYEVPILAIISEVYHSYQDGGRLSICTEKLRDKINKIKEIGDGIKIAEFGTRRRYSFMIHDHVLSMLLNEVPDNIVGTSNVFFAMKYNIKPIGTMAHELIQCAQQLFPLRTHQRDIMDLWAKEFEGNLGIALGDTIGIDAFLKDFNLKFVKLFDGFRHDSGNCVTVADKIVKHYRDYNIDPMTKTIVFSDGLDIDEAGKLYNHYKDIIKTSFGIGTHLTNDCGDKPLSIVLKIQVCNGFPVAKISDTPEKAVCRDKNYLNYLKSMFIKR